MEPYPVLTEELKNLDLDSDRSFTFQELASFDCVKLLELAFEKDQAKKKRSSTSFHLTSWWACKNQTKTNSKIQKLNRRTNFHSKPNGNVDFKNGTVRHSWPFRKHYQKKKNTIKRNWTHQTPVGIWSKKIIDEEKECLILEHLAGNPFLSGTTLLHSWRHSSRILKLAK